MKKSPLFLAALVATMSACTHSKTSTPTTNDSITTAADSSLSDTLTYQGEGPAADGSYEYSVSLYGDSLKEATLLKVGITPQGRDTLAMTTGLARVIVQEGKTYYRINEDRNAGDSLTFLQADANTLRLVSSDLKEATNAQLNTDLKRLR